MISAGKSPTNSSCLVQNNGSQQVVLQSHLQNYGGGGLVRADDVLSSSPLHQDIQTTAATSSAGSTSVAAAEQSSHSNAILYSLSVLKEEVHQLQSLVNVAIIAPHNHHQGGLVHQLHLHEPPHDDQSVAIAIAAMGTQIQEIIVTASSMMFTCQQLALSNSVNSPNINMGTHDHQLHQQWRIDNNKLHQVPPHHHDHVGLSSSQLSDPHHPSNVHVGSEDGGRGSFFTADNNEHTPHDNWYGGADNYVNNIHHHNNSTGGGNTINSHSNNRKMMVGEMGLLHEDDDHEVENKEIFDDFSPNNYEIVELEAADLLAKYTHYCQVCGKGFKRDANLRMHMRAHGDEYKSSAALSNPMKNSNVNSISKNNYYSNLMPRKYSCPQEGCRWNRKHPKFQPLKSMICVKNHYKRSHCPKMYVCNRCNQKQFSVLSDLRTHEKHCGDLKWQCSCGTTFSRKDKLMGHCALFFGHAPAGTTLTTRQPEKFDLHTEQILLN